MGGREGRGESNCHSRPLWGLECWILLARPPSLSMCAPCLPGGRARGPPWAGGLARNTRKLAGSLWDPFPRVKLAELRPAPTSRARRYLSLARRWALSLPTLRASRLRRAGKVLPGPWGARHRGSACRCTETQLPARKAGSSGPRAHPRANEDNARWAPPRRHPGSRRAAPMAERLRAAVPRRIGPGLRLAACC